MNQNTNQSGALRGVRSVFRDVVDYPEYDGGVLRRGALPTAVNSFSPDEAARAVMRGVNVVSTPNGSHVDMPRVSRSDYLELVFLAGDSYTEELEAALALVTPRGSRAWVEYMALHTVKRKAVSDGTGEYIVVPNYEPTYAPPTEVAWSKRASTDKVKKYTLAQIFSDTYLHDKYQISAKLRRDAQTLAVSNPMDAAATLQQAIQAVSPTAKIVVTAGGYATSTIRATDAIRSLASDRQPVQSVYRSDIAGKTLFIYGTEDKDGWLVQGPLKHAMAVADVHKLCCHSGLQEVMFLLANETALLQIEIYDGENYVSPYAIGHTNDTGDSLPHVSDERTLSRLTDVAHGRFLSVQQNLMPVLDSDGNAIASAIQVDPKMMLVNDHVKRVDADVTVMDRKLIGGVPVSHDLWMHNNDSVCEPWLVRDVQVGEEVAILYHNGTSAILSASFRVHSVDARHITYLKNTDVLPGMSGGALVSVVDFALLGVHCGATLLKLMAVAYTPTMQMDLIEMTASWAGTVERSEKNANAILAQLKNRGNHKQFLESIGCMVALTDTQGAHAGSAFVSDGMLHTTAPPVPYITTFGDVDPGVGASAFYSSCSVEGGDSAQVMLKRKPQLYEQVVVVVRASDGFYFTRQTSVKSVGAGGHTFTLASTIGNVYSLVGGLVMSVQDGACIGCFVRESTSASLGALSLCVVLPEASARAVDAAEAIQQSLPMLHVSAWENGLLDEALRHSSVNEGGLSSNKGLAKLGDAYLKLELYKVLYSAGVHEGEWTDYFKSIQSNAGGANIVKELRWNGLLRVQGGLRLPDNSHAFADMLEALMYVMATQEESSVTKEVLSLLGVVPTADELAGPNHPYGHMMRRASELAIVDVQDTGGTVMYSPVD